MSDPWAGRARAPVVGMLAYGAPVELGTLTVMRTRTSDWASTFLF